LQKYRLTIIVVVATCLIVPSVGAWLFAKFTQINYFNLIIESLVSIFVLYLLFAIQCFKKNKFYWNLNIGFYLLFVSYYVDAMDQIFIHSVLYTVLLEKITLVIAIIYIFIGVRQWMSSFENLSLTDDLTRIPNRRLVSQLIEKEIINCNKSNAEFSLAIVDIDLFKDINDDFGHNIGDKVLSLFAQLLDENLSEKHNVGRWGGEEFLIILKETNLKQAQKIMDGLRVKISQHKFLINNLSIQFTVSIGLSQYQNDKDNLESLFIQADKALYKAKKQGRNKVEIF